jgi:hypothetical protein
MGDSMGDRVTTGAVGILQIAGELLNFHAHVLILATEGGLCLARSGLTTRRRRS